MMFMKRLCFLILFLFSVAVIKPLFAQETAADLSSSIEQRVERFQIRYGIPLVYKNIILTNSNIHFQIISPQEYDLLNNYLALFEEEINKYPAEFFQRRQVRAVLLATHVFSRDIPAQGIYSADARVMIFDISRFSHNKALTRHSIHHELFHMMAFQTPGYVINDYAWVAMNTPGFNYGPHNGVPGAANPVNPQAPSKLGFVTDYAMSSVEEDKAEVFACLMQQQHRTLITRWAEVDEVLRKKIQTIKEFIAEDFPEMNAGTHQAEK